ncbi:hypothetical protein LSH36_922g01011 [Paralvinella palmiformis]|uniref:Solute carrier family 13 member 3 n=1 Tax=Paralvinella palmiformis TaxID=53620 RepID=A0AAD9MR48_9ANNE|nr:hypothetical protein LSH36_922g01011 [Paralvinella palmiformis]
MILLWFFRSPGFMKGWADIIRPLYINDSMVSILCTVALFIIPKDPINLGSQKQRGKVETLLNWKTIHEKYPWGIIFLIGGGFALSEACLASGLSKVIGKALEIVTSLPDWLMISVIVFIISLLTELTTNPAACALVMPIVANMAENMNVNPLYLMYPSVLATSYTFLFPVATPPNAVAFGFGRITVLDMVKGGLVLKLTVFVLTLAAQTWGMQYFHFDKPVWNINSTAVCSIS